ncbi:MAG: hypothetical protein R6W94_10630 [Spirochaetia bacterium]
MGEIIVPGQFQATATPFMDVVRDPRAGQYLFQRVEKIVADSFREDAQRQGKNVSQVRITQAEVKRRADIVGRWYRVMVADLRLSSAKAIDHLGRALRTELDGGTFTPPEQQRIWAPEDDK